ncbi:MAG: alpha/beta hydrolase family protein [bacterium]
MIKELTFYRDDLKINATLSLPEHAEKVPLVIISHGFGGNQSSHDEEAKWFVEEGLAVLTYDFIGGGLDIKSDGTMEEMSVLTEAEDLKVVLKEAAQMDEIDPLKIFLLGKSQGGFVSSYVAGQTPHAICGLILYYPAYVLQDDAKKRLATSTPTSVMGMKIGPIYNEDALSFDIYEVMGGYLEKVLIIHGTADAIVPMRYSVKALETYLSADLILIKNAGHGFIKDERSSAFRYALAYIRERLSL